MEATPAEKLGFARLTFDDLSALANRLCDGLFSTAIGAACSLGLPGVVRRTLVSSFATQRV
jgi:hypothetical protein